MKNCYNTLIPHSISSENFNKDDINISHKLNRHANEQHSKQVKTSCQLTNVHLIISQSVTNEIKLERLKGLRELLHCQRVFWKQHQNHKENSKQSTQNKLLLMKNINRKAFPDSTYGSHMLKALQLVHQVCPHPRESIFFLSFFKRFICDVLALRQDSKGQ